MAASCSLFDLEIRVPDSAGCVEGFRVWARSDAFPPRGRVAFIAGELFIDMSPEELQTHNHVKTEIIRSLANINRRADLGDVYSDGILVSHPGADLSTKPNVTFVSWKSLESGRVRLVPREGVRGEFMELEGAPDLVVEVVSQSSVRKDTRRLRDLYHRAGVREYWLIDARGAELSFVVLHRRKTGFVAARVRGGWQRSRVLGLEGRLRRRRRRRMSLWQYTLEHRP